MTADAHTFTAADEDRRRCTCGKSRNTAAHGYDAKARAAAKAAPAEESPVNPREASATEPAAAAGDPSFDVAAAERAAVEVAGTGRVDLAAEIRRALAAGHLDRLPALVAATVEPIAYERRRVADVTAMRTAKAAEVALDGTETTAEAVPTMETAKEATKKAPAPEPLRSLWVAAAFVPIILADTAPERATLVAKLDASTPNAQGGRTVRLTRPEAEELHTIGTEIENAAVASTEKGAGRMAHSARTMRNRLAALWP